MRPEAQMPDLDYTVIVKEPLVVAMPSDHRLVPRTLSRSRHRRERYLSAYRTRPLLQVVIDRLLETIGDKFRPSHRVDNLAMAMSLIAWTRGVALLPAYAENFLPWSVASRPLDGEAPTIDLVIGNNKTNTSPISDCSFAPRPAQEEGSANALTIRCFEMAMVGPNLYGWLLVALSARKLPLLRQHRAVLHA